MKIRLLLLLFGMISAGATIVQGADTFPADSRVGGFPVGCQAWTFKNFTAFEAIEKTSQTGGRLIEFYSSQKLIKEEPNVTWNHNASDETIAKVKAQLAKYNVRAINYGVVDARGEAEWRKIFEFAKKLDLYAITTESVDQLDIIEKLVKEFDIRVGIHEHQRRANDANYKVWDPNYVLSVVKDRDKRIGACADTGHWCTSGIKPLDALKILEGRIISVHLKDRTVLGRQTPDCIYGTGVVDIKAVLAELKRQNFAGHISIEYENNWDNSVPDVTKCIEFIRSNGPGR